MWRDPLLMAERGGWSALTDLEGKVRVTLREQTTVGCRHEGRYGLLHLRKNTVPPRTAIACCSRPIRNCACTSSPPTTSRP